MKPVYQIKKVESDAFQNIETLFDGVRILKVDGMLAKGKPVNIYNEQWIDSQSEDYLITTLDENDNPIVIRENVDIEVTFAVRQKYASNTIDVQQVHDSFVDYMTGSDVWIKSSYIGNKYAHCVCLSEYQPTIMKLNRGDNSFAMGTITFHCLDAPKNN